MEKQEKTIFAGGPVQYASEDGVFDENLKNIIICALNMLKMNGYKILSVHQEEEFGKSAVMQNPDDVCLHDYTWMQQCDIYICFLPVSKTGQIYRSDGTCIELGWASALGKPVVILMDKRSVYSQLIQGLNAITRVIHLDIKAFMDTPSLLTEAVRTLSCQRF